MTYTQNFTGWVEIFRDVWKERAFQAEGTDQSLSESSKEGSKAQNTVQRSTERRDEPRQVWRDQVTGSILSIRRMRAFSNRPWGSH